MQDSAAMALSEIVGTPLSGLELDIDRLVEQGLLRYLDAGELGYVHRAHEQ